nr:MAG TPA: hypothetical protein [Caudoviricetes sp.]
MLILLALEIIVIFQNNIDKHTKSTYNKKAPRNQSKDLTM